VRALLHDGGATVSVDGHLTAGNAALVVVEARRALACTPPSLTLDLRGTSHIDETGVAAVAGIRRVAAKRGTRLRLRCREGPVRRALRGAAGDAPAA
jgi:anti-anti-sigma regulatory factor